MKPNAFIYPSSNDVTYVVGTTGDSMTVTDKMNLRTKTRIAFILTGVVIILLIFDGIVPRLPFYDFRMQNSIAIHLYFVIVVTICVICQFFYLKIIRSSEIMSSRIGSFRRLSSIMFYSVSAIQFTIMGLLVFIVMQTEILNAYKSIAVSISILLSIFLSIGLTGILAYRFLGWLKYGRDRIVFAYTISMILFTLSLLSLAVFVLSEIGYNQGVIDSSRISASTQNITNFSIRDLQNSFSVISFLSFWVASVLLLGQVRRKWKTVRFWLLVTIPLAFYFGGFQMIVTYFVNQYDILTQIQSFTFDLISSIMTRPIGGVLFGVAFWTVAKSISNDDIKYSMRLCAFGIMLLSVSNVDNGIFMLPYPPFGLVTLSFLGISSYLLLAGIYSSAISISMDHKVRSSIHNSIESELKFVSKIGRSQMLHQIENRVNKTTRRFSAELEENSGIKPALEGKDLEEYIKFVLKERDQILHKKIESE